MDDKPPFNHQRAAFWLIAFVIAVECLVVLMGAGICLWHSEIIIVDPKIKCDPDGRLLQLLNAALTAALALWGIKKFDDK